jgi:hypothetical protein
MSRSRIVLVIAVFVLALVAIFVIRDSSDKKNRDYDFSFREFAVEEIENVEKILLFKRDGERIQLSRKRNVWYVNDKYIASSTAIANLLSAVKNVRIDYVPPDAAVENIMKSLMYNGIKVELYDKNGEAIKKFYVGDSPENSIGTYYLMENSASPLVLSLPGFKGNLRVRFSYTQDEWRDRSVYNIKPEEIEEVRMKYFFDKDNSFLLKRLNDGFILEPAFQDLKKSNTRVNNEFARTYLLGFENKGCEYIANNIEGREDILTRMPIVEIGLMLKGGKSKKLEIFMIPNLDSEVDENEDGINKYLNESVLRYIARDENDDLFLIQYEVFKDIFVSARSFSK